eukprot:166286-Alexandrium_andersonii.AAC.1
MPLLTCARRAACCRNSTAGSGNEARGGAAPCNRLRIDDAARRARAAGRKALPCASYVCLLPSPSVSR